MKVINLPTSVVVGKYVILNGCEHIENCLTQCLAHEVGWEGSA